ncbi:MAG: DUF5681 domain-containing protein [Pseudomonadota bacterium]
MTESSKETDDEVVGYRNPPKAHQFKKGQSGNPKGRPKGAKGLKKIFERELNERVTINENGKNRTLNKLEVTIKQLVTKAAKGDPRATEKLLDYLLRLADPDGESQADADLVSSEDAKIVDRAFARRSRERSDHVHSD